MAVGVTGDGPDGPRASSQGAVGRWSRAVAAAVDTNVQSRRWLQAVLRLARPLTPYAASRLVTLAAIGLVITLNAGFVTHRFAGPWPTTPPGMLVFKGMGTWDSGWYIHIASQGYDTSINPATGAGTAIAFFPLFPLLIKAVGVVTGYGLLTAGVLAAGLCGVAASILVWLVVREVDGPVVADRAVALWCFFPGAIVLSMVYAEGLTVALAAGCLLALLRRRWLVAGIAAGLATATQPDALVLILCCAWAAGWALWRDREWRSLLAPLLAPAGVIGYFAYLWVHTGSPLTWYHVEHRIWQGGLNFTTSTVQAVIGAYHAPGSLNVTVPALALGVLLIAGVLIWLWRPPAILILYAAGVVFLALGSGPVGARPRFLLVAFPVVVAFARWARGSAFYALLGGSAVLLALSMVVTLHGPGLTP